MPPNDNQPVVLFGLYRWAGTTPEEFRAHYLDHHVGIGKRIPGVAWYYAFLNTDPQRDGNSAPRPDAFAVMCFESADAFAQLSTTAEWAEAVADNVGFISHFDTYPVERVTLVPERPAS
ncbi:EthD domain-containing protein [Gordonia sp. OPL2]|uniref:EthD domain-containing protein n=1 Tax=Gordonia sp. OPL2 TaxID=2486274 RepID=UPI0016559831|nr:EthD domain-containing protein [Gordonia sp. OPL2]ROZ99078.1 EthD family reductase [Gordonia sp. OPL2]